MSFQFCIKSFNQFSLKLIQTLHLMFHHANQNIVLLRFTFDQENKMKSIVLYPHHKYILTTQHKLKGFPVLTQLCQKVHGIIFDIDRDEKYSFLSATI